MELKDVILSTLAEMEETPVPRKVPKFEVKETISVQTPIPPIKKEVLAPELSEDTTDSELMYLNSIKERLLVLFEGFQAPNNTNIEAKVDMTLNFLEYTLATIDTRVDMLEKRKK